MTMPAPADAFTAEYGSIVAAPPVNDPLAPYVPTTSKPWNARRVAHLYRRLGFGATYAQIQQGLQMTPSALVDQLLDTATALPAPTPPTWANWTFQQYNGDLGLLNEHTKELKRRWLLDMIQEGIRAKMAFFWHDHFVTQLMIYTCNSWMWNYYSLLHQYAFGNFRTFAYEIGKSPAMLMFLNGNLNIVDEPNENYARELMELFTMGESNGYTQADIVEMARALTGWQADDDDCTPASYNSAKHDNSPKTIFGQTANYDFEGAHNLIFTARSEQVAHYIPGKIYKWFVYQNADPQVIEGLAATFKNGNWEIMPVMKQLFKSEHFFEESLINAKIKSPLETMASLLKMTGAVSPTHITNHWLNEINYYAYILHQDLFEPPNVSGWKEHRHWINESTLSLRWKYAAGTIGLLQQNNGIRDNLRDLAIELTNNSKDPAVIVPALVDFFLGQTLDPVHLQAAIGYFKAGIPENYYLDGSWNLLWSEAPDQIFNLMLYLVKLPEFQLT
ncbi:MAG: DUF1800 domain-containing protein [Haliscomenobacteraceae bacterium CHB4]|nr:DUF1800 domain-containing protein [Haliscomenobacteraceae bacterium CHB4]